MNEEEKEVPDHAERQKRDFSAFRPNSDASLRLEKMPAGLKTTGQGL